MVVSAAWAMRRAQFVRGYTPFLDSQFILRFTDLAEIRKEIVIHGNGLIRSSGQRGLTLEAVEGIGLAGGERTDSPRVDR